ncbi:hypothetical protein E1189_16440 [Sansalvadorimonas verongulae]|nr:hypothetical protein [Sansalvadorimonas verongulae]
MEQSSRQPAVYAGATLIFGDSQEELQDNLSPSNDTTVVNMPEITDFDEQGAMIPSNQIADLPEQIPAANLCLLTHPISETRLRKSTQQALFALLRHLPKDVNGRMNIERFRIVLTGAPENIGLSKAERNNTTMSPEQIRKTRVEEWVHHLSDTIREHFGVEIPKTSFLVANEEWQPILSDFQVGPEAIAEEIRSPR